MSNLVFPLGLLVMLNSDCLSGLLVVLNLGCPSGVPLTSDVGFPLETRNCNVIFKYFVNVAYF